MKTLNRTLSLTLVFALVFSLMSFAFAANATTTTGAGYTDASSITYKEAVDVMSGIKVINGYDNGNFGPKDSLTRAQAAKMVAYTVLDESVAATLPVKASSYKDVNANNAWAIPSIEYLTSKGIVAGYGDGNFGPNDKVTGYQLAKMLLIASGVKNDFSGESWELNTAIAAKKAGIFADSKATNFSTAATREEAALYCFNAIQYSPTSNETKTVTQYLVMKVSGSTNADSINGNLYNSVAAAVTAGKALTPAAELGTDYTLTPVTATVSVATDSIASTVYPSLTKIDAANGVDAFGRPAARAWSYKTKTISTVYSSDAVATFTTPVTLSTLYNTLGCTATNKTVALYVDGVKKTDVTANKSDVDTANAIGGYGMTTELYKESDGSMTAVVISHYLAKVTSVTAYKAATATSVEVPASITVTVNTVNPTTYARYDIPGLTFETTGFAKGDYVYVTMASGAVKSAAKATAVDGKMTSYGTGYIVANGQKIPVCKTAQNLTVADASKAALVLHPEEVGFTDTYTVYLDNNMAIVGAKLKEASVGDYAYIVKTEYKNETSIAGASRYAKAQVVFTDGTTTVVDMPITKNSADGKYYSATPVGAGTVTASVELSDTNNVAALGNWFGYVKNSDGTYSFTALSATNAASSVGMKLTKDTATVTNGTGTAISGVLASVTNVTAFDGNLVKTSFTGLPTKNYTFTGNVLYTYTSAGVITNIYAAGQATATTTPTYGYYVGKGETTSTGTAYKFYVGGAVKEYVISGGLSATKGEVYTITTTGTTSTATKVTTADDVVIATGKTVQGIDKTYAVIDNSVLYFADTGVEMYNATDDGTGAKQTIAADDTVTYVTVGGKLAVVYITTVG